MSFIKLICLSSPLLFHQSIAIPTNLTTPNIIPQPDLTNPSLLFPSEDALGYQGPTEVGVEPSLIQVPFQQPNLRSHFPILNQNHLNQSITTTSSTYSPHHNTTHQTQPKLIYQWGNLSPMHSLPHETFSIQTGPGIPPGCQAEQLHLLHRHGARYPTGDAALAVFGKRIQTAQATHQFEATGALKFLNTWSYQLGSEILTPFGRSQLFDMGVSYRQRYGFLLKKMSDRRPVFRTTTQDRMYHSALNFAAGFFGLPSDDAYFQQILIEHKGFNNSLASYDSCPNSDKPEIGDLGRKFSSQWASLYLSDATDRFNQQVTGLNFTSADLFNMQLLCSYETVALGISHFCTLFTEEEWLDYAYALDLSFWYSSSFGNPTSAAIGLGYTQELLARLSGQRLPLSPSSINTTLYNDPRTFPLDQSIYVDATHDTVISSVVVSLNLTGLAARGPLPTTHRDPARTFRVEQIAPFAAQLATQVISCPINGTSQDFVRLVLNDAVIPISGLGDCGSDTDGAKWGMCKLGTFVEGLKTRVAEIDFNQACFANYTYEVPSNGGGVTNGRLI